MAKKIYTLVRRGERSKRWMFECSDDSRGLAAFSLRTHVAAGYKKDDLKIISTVATKAAIKAAIAALNTKL